MKPSQKLEKLLRDIIDADLENWTGAGALTVETDIDAPDITRPFVHVVAGDGEEHEVLRGVYTGDVIATIEANANETTAANIKSWAGSLHHLLGNIPTLRGLLNTDPRPVEDFHAFDVRTSEPQTQRNDSTWLVSVTLRVVYMGADKSG